MLECWSEVLYDSKHSRSIRVRLTVAPPHAPETEVRVGSKNPPILEAPMLPGVAETIIQAETNHTRFENFCREIFELHERITLVPTSVTYDRGRDARSITRARGSHAAILCCTLNKELDDKVAADIRRVTATSDTDRLIYCSSQKITEDKVDQLEANIRTQMNARPSLLVVGAIQLAHLADQYSGVFDKYYQSEQHTIEAHLQAFVGSGEKTETKGLRLALIAFQSEDARALRRVISRRAILELLRLLQKGEPASLAAKLSQDLCLPAPVDVQVIESVLGEMRNEGVVSELAGQWSLTQRGEAEAGSIPPEAARDLLAGRNLVREKLKELTGIDLAESQFDLIWSTLLDFLGELFHSNGLTVIAAIEALLTGRTDTPATQINLEKLLEAGAKKVKATVSSPMLADEIEQAILDMFTERSGPAFEWLTRVCERFVALCALGLESKSADEIRRIVLRNEIILDSDIVLTMLCEGESDHEAARELIGRWRQLGGRFLVALPVLEEVAYHAWISERDFEGTKFLLGTLREVENGRYIGNAFVRAFYCVAKNASEVRKWPIYIRQFKGSVKGDYSNLLSVLQTDLAAEILPAGYDEKLKDEILEFLKGSLARSRKVEVSELDEDDLIKFERDSRLLASIAAARSSHRQMGTDRTTLLLSSSVRLRRVATQYRASLGSPPAVIPLAAFSFLLSMLPGVQIGAGTLRRALFEFGETAHLPDTERLALRVIRAQGDFDIPWARRNTLQYELESSIHREASKLGISSRALREKFTSADESARPAEIILDALRNMAANDSKLRELETANRRIGMLQSKVDTLEKRLKERFKEPGGHL